MVRKNRRRFLWWLALGIGVVSVGSALQWVASTSADTPGRKTPNGDLLETVLPGNLPSFALQKGPQVREAYRYAVDHEDILQYIPCFCGCKNIGHAHNAACYITERLADGQVTFNSHAAT
jgi:hypothetical protein